MYRVPEKKPSIRPNREYALFFMFHRILNMYKRVSNAIPCSSRLNNLPDRAATSVRGNLVILRAASVSAVAVWNDVASDVAGT